MLSLSIGHDDLDKGITRKAGQAASVLVDGRTTMFPVPVGSISSTGESNVSDDASDATKAGQSRITRLSAPSTA